MEEWIMLDAPAAAQKFLDSMNEEDQQRLLNALIGLNTTHNLNRDTSFYSYRNLKKMMHPKQSQAMQSLHFTNTTQDTLIIRQLKEHSFLKNSYRIEILFNAVSYDYQLVTTLLQLLHESCFVDVYSYA